MSDELRTDTPEYQALCSTVEQAVFTLLNGLGGLLPADAHQHVNIGPLVVGALAATIELAVNCNMTDETIRGCFIDSLDSALPQIRMAQLAGGAAEGHA